MSTRRQHATQQRAALTYEKPVIPQVVQLALPFESGVKLEVCAGGDHTLSFVSNGDAICLGAFQQRKSAASGLRRWDAVSWKVLQHIPHPLSPKGTVEALTQSSKQTQRPWDQAREAPPSGYNSAPLTPLQRFV